MEKRIIDCTSMTADAFAEYGIWINDSSREPDANAYDLKFWNKLGVLDHRGNTSVSIVQTYGKNGLIEETLEQHKTTGEALLPTEDIYIVVALSSKEEQGKPDLNTVKAFQVKRGEAVILHPKVWHHAPLTRAGQANTFVIFYENTPEEDCFSYELKNEFGLYYEVNP